MSNASTLINEHNAGKHETCEEPYCIACAEEVGPELRRCAICGEYKVCEAGADEDAVCNDCPKEA